MEENLEKQPVEENKQENKIIPVSETVVLDKDEKVLYKARVGRKIIRAFVGITVFLIALGLLLIILGVFAIQKDIPNAWLIALFGGLLMIVGCFVPFVCKSILKRQYILTNKKIIVETGGKILKGRRILGLANIKGVILSNNILFSAHDICTLDFFAPSVQFKISTILKIFSFSGTKFKFQFITKEDGENIYKLIQEQGLLYK